MYGQILSLSGQDVKYKVTIGCRKEIVNYTS